MKTFAAFTTVTVLVLSFLYVKLSFETERIKTVLAIEAKQNVLLQNLCRDYEYKISITKTYDDGYRDALVKMSNPTSGNFQEGFEAAKLVYGSGSYTEGYHNAVAQFGYNREDIVKTSKKEEE